MGRESEQGQRLRDDEAGDRLAGAGWIGREVGRADRGGRVWAAARRADQLEPSPRGSLRIVIASLARNPVTVTIEP